MRVRGLRFRLSLLYACVPQMFETLVPAGIEVLRQRRVDISFSIDGGSVDPRRQQDPQEVHQER